MRRLLWRKMIRDIRKSFVTYGLCVLIVAIGFCGYSVLELCYENLKEARDAFLRDSSFCDGFADVTRAPESLVKHLETIEGIETAKARLVKTVRAVGYDGEVELCLTSWKADGMNQPVLSQGTYPRAGKREIVIGSGIAQARGIRPGDAIELVISGKRVSVEVTGVGLSPENIYMIKNISDMFPDPSSYDAGFMPYDTMVKLFSMEGEANSFLFRLRPGRSWKEAEEAVKQALKPYGCRSVYGRGDQLSINMVNTEIEQLAKMSGVVPLLFLTVAGVILYITLSRLVEQQRPQVGTLMALGFPVRQIQAHYMCYGMFTGCLGGALGGVLGYAAAGPMADYYRMYFSLPQVTTPFSVSYMGVGVLVATAFCGGTAYLIAGAVGRLSPADALKPAAPKAARVSWMERIPGARGLFTVPGLMAVRSLARNRRRTMFSLAGISFAYMITASLVSMNSLFNVFLFDYWEKTQQQDITVQFESPVRSTDALDAVRRPGVGTAEGIMEFPVTLKGPEGKLDCTIQAIPEDSTLVKLFHKDGGRVYVEEEGIVLSEHMARRLGVGVNDQVTVNVSYPKERSTSARVTGVVAQYLGSAAYMSHKGAERVSEYRDVYSAVLLKAPSGVMEELLGRLEAAESVSLVESRQGRIDKYRSMMGSMSAIMASMSMMGVVIGFAVIYVSSLIGFEELKREISILMMLGLKSDECLDVISTSQWILSAGAVILGIPMTMAVSRLISVSMASDLYTIPDFVNGASLLQAMGLTALSVGFSSMMMLRKLKKMSPAQLLKGRE